MSLYNVDISFNNKGFMYKDFDYEYRKKVYRENSYDVIFLHLFKDSNKWKKYFLGYLAGLSNFRNKKLDLITEKITGKLFSDI